MKTPADTHERKRKRNRKRKIPRSRTAIWSVDGATLLAVVEGPVTPDDVEAARLLALQATPPTT